MVDGGMRVDRLDASLFAHLAEAAAAAGAAEDGAGAGAGDATTDACFAFSTFAKPVSGVRYRKSCCGTKRDMRDKREGG